MVRRGDNDKHTVAENQLYFADKEQQSKSNRHKQPTGGQGQRFEKQEKTKDPGADRNSGMATKKIKPLCTDERTFDLLVDGVPYFISSVPFFFNDELCFRISVNENTDYVFTWDSEPGSLRSIDDNAAILPDGLEEAISEKLQTF